MKQLKTFTFLLFIFLGFSNNQIQAQEKIVVKGIVIDEFDNPIPFAAITLVGKTKGTSSTEDGGFSIFLTTAELEDTLSFSSLGFTPKMIKVKDYLAQKEQKIVLKESVMEMDEITILPPKHYVLSAIKKLKENTLSTPHKLEILFRRAATEEGKSKFFVENYVAVRDRGPAYSTGQIQVLHTRKSADYRYWKREQWRHPIVGMHEVNPLRPIASQHSRNLKKFKWVVDGETSYDGEEVLILKGNNPKKDWEKIILYIGIESYKVYRIERGKSLYIYKKHQNGKLVISYYKNDWSFPKWNVPKEMLGTPAETLRYQLEAFVYDVQTDKKKIKVNAYGIDKDMGNLEIPYDPVFWKNLSMPPDTKFYKKIKSGLESNFGVPLETQYKLVNK